MIPVPHNDDPDLEIIAGDDQQGMTVDQGQPARAGTKRHTEVEAPSPTRQRGRPKGLPHWKTSEPYSGNKPSR